MSRHLMVTAGAFCGRRILRRSVAVALLTLSALSELSAQVPRAAAPASMPATQPAADAAWPFDAKEAARRQEQAAKALGIPREKVLDLGDKVSLRLVLIPAGRFQMGSGETDKDHGANGLPQHEVALTKACYLGVCKVTQAQYEKVIGKNPSQHVGPTLPVDSVTWDDAVAFCQKASEKTKTRIHLPTEAQWEYACRAGAATAYHFGDDGAKLGDYAWFPGNANNMTHPVGQKKPNAFGLYDMHGNAWDWCADFFAPTYADAGKIDPTGPATGTTHVVRGGTYGVRVSLMRSALRAGFGSVSPAALARCSFRVVLEVE